MPRALRPAARAVRSGAGYWRRSLQLRVVAGTLLLSTAVIVVTGWVLLQQVTSGILEAKQASAVAEASTGIREAQETIDLTEPTDDSSQVRKDLTTDLARRGTQTGLYDLILRVDRADDNQAEPSTVIPANLVSDRVEESSVPDRLRERIEIGQLAITYTEIVRTDGTRSPGLVVASRLQEPQSGAELTVFYLFDLTQQQDTLTLLQRSLVAVGVLIVALLGFVAWFVTRQVVTPVRIARKTAERLAAGVLDERMQVRGQDDLARLATSFNQMAASLQRQIRQLEELSRVQRRFVSDVSHELRTPLTTVRMAADLLYEARADFGPATARSAELLQTELDRFESLLSDLLEISRFDAGAAVLDLEDIDLRMLTQRVVDGARRLAERRGSRLSLRLSEQPCVAQVDPRRIERVVRNLVVNAIEYGEGRDIDVQVAGDDHATAVSVRDHGIGLKPGESAMVFDRFWRADPARARTTGGTGLGLAIALEDVLLHGGWLQAWGEPGRGAHFRLTVPRRSTDTLDHSPIPLVPDDARRHALAITSSSHVEAGPKR
ncbi:two-component system sensor histidine kinase MtrB [Flindersiella endophytica]